MFEHITKVLTGLKLIKFINSLIDLINSHLSNYNNPHKVTAEQLGLATVYRYKGSVATYADLPTTGQKVGDVWNVETANPDHGIKAGDNVAWDGAQWDILGGNHDLSGYAQLNSANTFTALNVFRANIAVSNGTAAGSQGQVIFGVKPSTATVQAKINSAATGAMHYAATENTGHYFRIGNNIAAMSITTNKGESAILSHNAFEFARISNVGIANWLGNAKTATKLETARTINGVPFDGTKDITIEVGGDVTTTGDNNFTGTNTFNKPITVRDGALASIGGTIALGVKPSTATVQAKINSAATGAMYYTATENTGHYFKIGNNIAAMSITTDKGQSALLSHNNFEFARISNVGVANWLGNAKTATKLETARTINGVPFDGTKDITIAEDALIKIEQLSVLNYYNNLTEATDVNTLVDVHRWYLQASNNPNAPETNPGFLNVDNDYNDSVCKQLWVSETTGAIYNRFGQIVENSDPATVSSWSEWYKLATKADIDGTTTDLTKKITTVANNLATHEADFSNPHKVTAEQLGLSNAYKYKGSVPTYQDLPSTAESGDVYNVVKGDKEIGVANGANFAWNGSEWDNLGGLLTGTGAIRVEFMVISWQEDTSTGLYKLPLNIFEQVDSVGVLSVEAIENGQRHSVLLDTIGNDLISMNAFDGAIYYTTFREVS